MSPVECRLGGPPRFCTRFALARRRPSRARAVRSAATSASTTTAQRESEFLAALASGRDARAKPTVQDLERYAARVGAARPEPASPARRDRPASRRGGAVARATASRACAPRSDSTRRPRRPRTNARRALGSTRIFDRRAQRARSGSRGAAPRSRSAWSGFRRSGSPSRSRSPSASGPGILALPVAMAGIGPLGAVVLIVVFGARQRAHCRRAGRVDHPHRVDAIRVGVLRPSRRRALRAVRRRAAGRGGARAQRGDADRRADRLRVGPLRRPIGLPLWMWATALFAANLALLARERLDATIASAVVVGAVNIVLILALCGDRVRPPAAGELRAGQHPGARRSSGRYRRAGARLRGRSARVLRPHLSGELGQGGARARPRAVGRSCAATSPRSSVADRAVRPDRRVIRRRARTRSARRTRRGRRSSRWPIAAAPPSRCSAQCSPCWRSAWARSTPRSGLYNQVVEWRPQRDRLRRFASGAALPTALFGSCCGSSLPTASRSPRRSATRARSPSRCSAA